MRQKRRSDGSNGTQFSLQIIDRLGTSSGFRSIPQLPRVDWRDEYVVGECAVRLDVVWRKRSARQTSSMGDVGSSGRNGRLRGRAKDCKEKVWISD